MKYPTITCMQSPNFMHPIEHLLLVKIINVPLTKTTEKGTDKNYIVNNTKD